MKKITNLYDKEIELQCKIDFYDLEKTGSWDDADNQVLVMKIPKEMGKLIREEYRRKNPQGIKNLEIIRDNDIWEMYFGSSYGASVLFGAVGELLYTVKRE